MALGLRPLSNVTLAMLYILYSLGHFPLGLEYHLGIPALGLGIRFLNLHEATYLHTYEDCQIFKVYRDRYVIIHRPSGS